MLLVLAPSSASPLQILSYFFRLSPPHCLFVKYKTKTPPKTRVKCAAKSNPHQPGPSQPWETANLGETDSDIKPNHGHCFLTKPLPNCKWQEKPQRLCSRTWPAQFMTPPWHPACPRCSAGETEARGRFVTHLPGGWMGPAGCKNS